MRIRRATRRDIPACVRICSKVWPGTKWSRYIGRDMAASLNYSGGSYFVAERDGKVVGACEMRISPASIYITEMSWIMVDPPYQKQGVGTKLMRKGIAWTRLKKANLLLLGARITKYYQKFGFRKLQPFRNENWLMGLDVRKQDGGSASRRISRRRGSPRATSGSGRHRG